MPYFLTRVFLTFKESFLTFKESTVREMPLSKFKVQFSATNRAVAGIIHSYSESFALVSMFPRITYILCDSFTLQLQELGLNLGLPSALLSLHDLLI